MDDRLRVVGRKDEAEQDHINARNSRERAGDGAHLCILRQKVTPEHLEVRNRRRSAVKTICTPRTRGSRDPRSPVIITRKRFPFCRFLASRRVFPRRRLQQYVCRAIIAQSYSIRSLITKFFKTFIVKIEANKLIYIIRIVNVIYRSALFYQKSKKKSFIFNGS